MEIIVVPDAVAVAARAADLIERAVRNRDRPVLGLCTGSSPRATYAELARRNRDEGLSFARAQVFHLDEYVGFGPGNPQSYSREIDEQFVSRVDLDPAAVHLLDGSADDLEGECRSYEAQIDAAGGIDLQLLGVGRNGHIGFNEPTSSLASRTRIKTLTDETRRANARFFEHPDEVPFHALTMGVGTISEARALVLIAAGRKKAAPIARAVEGPVTAMAPASAVQLHPGATVVVDEAAAAELQLLDYYRQIARRKSELPGR